MRKLLWVSLMILLVASPALAQDEESSGPESGLFFEISASPFNRDGRVNGDQLLNFGQFRARYFLDETMVPRLGIWFAADDNAGGANPPDVVTSTFDYMFTPGFEWHFLNEGGFTTYAALDVILTGRSASRESNTSEEVIGSTQVPTSPDYVFSPGQRGFFGWGLAGSVGAEYHTKSRFYFGAEIGLQFVAGTSSDVEVDGVLFQEGIQFFDAGVTTMNTFRVGFKLF